MDGNVTWIDTEVDSNADFFPFLLLKNTYRPEIGGKKWF